MVIWCGGTLLGSEWRCECLPYLGHVQTVPRLPTRGMEQGFCFPSCCKRGCSSSAWGHICHPLPGPNGQRDLSQGLREFVPSPGWSLVSQETQPPAQTGRPQELGCAGLEVLQQCKGSSSQQTPVCPERSPCDGTFRRGGPRHRCPELSLAWRWLLPPQHAEVPMSSCVSSCPVSRRHHQPGEQGRIATPLPTATSPEMERAPALKWPPQVCNAW